MGDTNYISCVVKIIEVPSQTIFNKTIPITKFRAQLPQIRKNSLINLIFWGKLSYDVLNYYGIDDYIIVEGYVSLQEDLTKKDSKTVEISVLKVYPFILNCQS